MTMKKSTVIFSLLLLGMMILVQSYTLPEPSASPSEDIDIPENVKVILDNKCFGCHNVEAKSDKAKEKLLLDKLSDLSKVELIGALGEIHEVVVEGEMPPEKFLERKPEGALTDEEAKLLADWAEKAADALTE